MNRGSEIMTKLLTTLNTLEDYEKVKEYIDGFILGVSGLSINYPNTYSVEELKQWIPILQKDGKEVFLSVNKNMHASDLELLESVMKEFDSFSINAFLYYDIAVVTIKKDKNLKTPLVWGQEHLSTNYMTCNYWYQFGAEYSYLSGEITMDEIIEIKKHAKSKVIVPIFGRLPMFASRRHLVQNYLAFFDLKTDASSFQIEKEGRRYPIVDDQYGTVVYSAHYLNGLKESLSLRKEGIDYFYLNPDGIEFEKWISILQKYREVTEENQDALEQEIDLLLEGNTDKGFLYKETVYKVIS